MDLEGQIEQPKPIETDNQPLETIPWHVALVPILIIPLFIAPLFFAPLLLIVAALIALLFSYRMGK